MVTADTIMDWLRKQVEEKNPVSPLQFLEAAVKLEALMGNETDKLADAEHAVSVLKLSYLKSQDKRNVSEAKAFVEASEEHLLARKQRGRVDQIKEFVMLAKKYATLKSEEYHS